MQSLQQAGTLDAISLSGLMPDTAQTAPPVWHQEYSRRTVALSSQSREVERRRRPLMQAAMAVLLPFRRMWVPWLGYLQQYGHEASVQALH